MRKKWKIDIYDDWWMIWLIYLFDFLLNEMEKLLIHRIWFIWIMSIPSLIIFEQCFTFVINFIFQQMSNLPSAILSEKYREWKNNFFRPWKKKYGNQYVSAFWISTFFTFTIGGTMTYACYWIFLKKVCYYSFQYSKL